MANSDINVDVTQRVMKPVNDVFQAIVDPDNCRSISSPAPPRRWQRVSQ